MKKFILFLGNVYKSESPESSKRFFGSIGFLTAIVYIALWDRTLINELMYVSAGMVGFDAVVKLIGYFRKKK
jgi:hypothetical protein